jgi:hypothetical protein
MYTCAASVYNGAAFRSGAYCGVNDFLANPLLTITTINSKLILLLQSILPLLSILQRTLQIDQMCNTIKIFYIEHKSDSISGPVQGCFPDDQFQNFICHFRFHNRQYDFFFGIVIYTQRLQIRVVGLIPLPKKTVLPPAPASLISETILLAKPLFTIVVISL